MIDVHCHFDLAENPQEFIAKKESKKIITLGMTNLPSHFVLGVEHVKHFKYIRLALGLHPLLVDRREDEYKLFNECLHRTSYIGEVGLDFSAEGVNTKDIQLESLEYVFDSISKCNSPKIISIHCRRAEKDVLLLLDKYNIKNVIFHWYSGSLEMLKILIDRNFFFSVNSAMIESKKGQSIIQNIPKNLMLTETDFPFIDQSSIESIYKYLSAIWELSEEGVENHVDQNLKILLTCINS